MSAATVLNFRRPEKAAAPESGSGTRYAGSKILLVEDDVMIAKALSIRLKASGYQVVTAADAVGATALAVKESPDLMILDISLPGGDGFLVAQRVQKLSATMGIPFVFITASRQPGLREKALSLGAQAFFEKPYDTAELLEAIEKAVA